MNIHLINHFGALEEAYGLVLTSNSVERSAAEAVFGSMKKADIGLKTLGSSMTFVDPHILLHLTGRAGGSDDLSPGRLARHLLHRPMPRPSFVILLGMGWGRPDKTQIGDVVVTTDLVSLNHQRITPAGPVYRRRSLASALGVPPVVLERLSDAADGFAVLGGPMGTLETHYASDAARDALLTQVPDIIGGEMEAYDLLPDVVGLPWVVVKGLSDHGGDDTARVDQELAAKNAASLVPVLLGALTGEGELPRIAETAERNALIQSLIGTAIAVSPPPDPRRLNDYLNNQVGELLERALSRYAFEGGDNADLQACLTDVILESLQNSFRHGAAGSASIEFNETKVIVRDNGRGFSLESLTGESGGARAWNEFRTDFVGPGLVSYAHKRIAGGNLHTFKFERLREELRIARHRCSATVAPMSIRSVAHTSPVLLYDSTCQTIHVSTRSNRMTSRQLEVAEAVRREIQSGRKVFVECSNERDAERQRILLKDCAGPLLRIYIGAKA